MSKRVLVITQFFAPEPCAAAHRMRALCRALVEAGDDVTVLTGFPNFPQGRLALGDRGVWYRRETIEGVRVERVGSLVGAPIARRLIAWITLAVAMSLYVLVKCRRVDATIVSLPHVPLALPALLAAFASRCRLIVDVRDVFPDIAVAMGKWRKGGLLERAVGWIVDRLYARADTVVAVTETALDQIAARGVARSRLLLAPNGFDPVDVECRRAEPRLTFDLVFAGNLGLTTGVEVILAAAELLASESRFRFVVVGGGAQWPWLGTQIASRGLTNVEARGAVPRMAALQALADADVAIVALRPGIVESIPTKLFDAFSARTPVIACLDGEARRLLERNGAGIVVPPDDAEALVRAIRRIESDATLASTLTANAAALLSNHRNRLQIMRDLRTQIA
jgi:glycosyltransferase involved in cell wall biosynthesis